MSVRHKHVKHSYAYLLMFKNAMILIFSTVSLLRLHVYSHTARNRLAHHIMSAVWDMPFEFMF